MTILSEAGVRKIVRNKLVTEIGFRNVSSDAGTVSYDKCDFGSLSSPAKIDLVVKFAKHFLFNPQMKRPSGTGEEIYTDRHFISFVTGFKNLTFDEQNKYDRDVKEYLTNNREIIDKYVDLISYGITVAFGKLAPLYCKSISAFLSASYLTDFESEPTEDIIDVEETKEKFILKAKETGKNFKSEFGIGRAILQDIPECVLISPKTTKLFAEGDTSAAKSEFRKEKSDIEAIILATEVKPQQIFEELEIIFNRNSFRNRSKILKPIRTFMFNSNIQTVEHGDEIREALSEILNDGANYWSRRLP